MQDNNDHLKHLAFSVRVVRDALNKLRADIKESRPHDILQLLTYLDIHFEKQSSLLKSMAYYAQASKSPSTVDASLTQLHRDHVKTLSESSQHRFAHSACHDEVHLLRESKGKSAVQVKHHMDLLQSLLERSASESSSEFLDLLHNNLAQVLRDLSGYLLYHQVHEQPSLPFPCEAIAHLADPDAVNLCGKSAEPVEILDEHMESTTNALTSPVKNHSESTSTTKSRDYGRPPIPEFMRNPQKTGLKKCRRPKKALILPPDTPKHCAAESSDVQHRDPITPLPKPQIDDKVNVPVEKINRNEDPRYALEDPILTDDDWLPSAYYAKPVHNETKVIQEDIPDCWEELLDREEFASDEQIDKEDVETAKGSLIIASHPSSNYMSKSTAKKVHAKASPPDNAPASFSAEIIKTAPLFSEDATSAAFADPFFVEGSFATVDSEKSLPHDVGPSMETTAITLPKKEESSVAGTDCSAPLAVMVIDESEMMGCADAAATSSPNSDCLIENYAAHFEPSQHSPADLTRHLSSIETRQPCPVSEFESKGPSGFISAKLDRLDGSALLPSEVVNNEIEAKSALEALGDSSNVTNTAFVVQNHDDGMNAVAGAESLIVRDKSFSVDESVELNNQPLSADEPIAVDNLPLSVNEPIPVDTKPLSVDESVELDNQPLSQNEPVESGILPLSVDEHVAVDCEPLSVDESIVVGKVNLENDEDETVEAIDIFTSATDAANLDDSKADVVAALKSNDGVLSLHSTNDIEESFESMPINHSHVSNESPSTIPEINRHLEQLSSTVIGSLEPNSDYASTTFTHGKSGADSESQSSCLRQNDSKYGTQRDFDVQLPLQRCEDDNRASSELADHSENDFSVICLEDAAALNSAGNHDANEKIENHQNDNFPPPSTLHVHSLIHENELEKADDSRDGIVLDNSLDVVQCPSYAPPLPKNVEKEMEIPLESAPMCSLTSLNADSDLKKLPLYFDPPTFEQAKLALDREPGYQPANALNHPDSSKHEISLSNPTPDDTQLFLGAAGLGNSVVPSLPSDAPSGIDAENADSIQISNEPLCDTSLVVENPFEAPSETQTIQSLSTFEPPAIDFSSPSECESSTVQLDKAETAVNPISVLVKDSFPLELDAVAKELDCDPVLENAAEEVVAETGSPKMVKMLEDSSLPMFASEIELSSGNDQRVVTRRPPQPLNHGIDLVNVAQSGFIPSTTPMSFHSRASDISSRQKVQSECTDLSGMSDDSRNLPAAFTADNSLTESVEQLPNKQLDSNVTTFDSQEFPEYEMAVAASLLTPTCPIGEESKSSQAHNDSDDAANVLVDEDKAKESVHSTSITSSDAAVGFGVASSDSSSDYATTLNESTKPRAAWFKPILNLFGKADNFKRESSPLLKNQKDSHASATKHENVEAREQEPEEFSAFQTDSIPPHPTDEFYANLKELKAEQCSAAGNQSDLAHLGSASEIDDSRELFDRKFGKSIDEFEPVNIDFEGEKMEIAASAVDISSADNGVEPAPISQNKWKSTPAVNDDPSAYHVAVSVPSNLKSVDPQVEANLPTQMSLKNTFAELKDPTVVQASDSICNDDAKSMKKLAESNPTPKLNYPQFHASFNPIIMRMMQGQSEGGIEMPMDASSVKSLLMAMQAAHQQQLDNLEAKVVAKDKASEMLKGQIADLAADNKELETQLDQAEAKIVVTQLENETLMSKIVNLSADNDELMDRNQKCTDYAKLLEREIEEAKGGAESSKGALLASCDLDTATTSAEPLLKPALESAPKEDSQIVSDVSFENVAPLELSQMIDRLKETACAGSKGYLTRLKRIWTALMKMYMESDDIPDIEEIADEEFVLDQIEISVTILTSFMNNHVHMAQFPNVERRDAMKMFKEVAEVRRCVDRQVKMENGMSCPQ